MNFLSRKKDISIHRFVMVSRRDDQTIYTQRGEQLTHLFNFFHLRFLKHRCVRGDVISKPFAFSNHSNSLIEYAVPVANLVMRIPHTVKMNIDRQAFVGLNSTVYLRIE